MSRDPLHPKFLSWSLLIALSLIWGSSFILIKKGLTVYSPPEVAGIRIFTASLFMMPFAISRFRRVDKKYYFLIFFTGFIGSFIPAILFAVAQTRLDSAITGIMNALTPAFVMIVGVLFYRQRTTMLQVAGLILAFGGTAMLMFIRTGGTVENVNFFILLVVLATLLYGINVNILKFNLSEIGHLAISSISIFSIGFLAAAQLFFFTDFTQKLMHEEKAFLALFYITFLGMIGTGFALMLFNKLLKITSPIFSSSVTYFIPIVAVFWGIIDGERLTLLHFLSMAVIITGVFMTNRKG